MKFRKSDYQISPIDYHTAMKVVIEKHYLHRKAPCSFAYGLYNDGLKGVIVYGTPSSAPLRRGICGEEEKHNVIELTRLWIDDKVPTNAASFLIGNTLKLVDKDIIVSYADTSQGHIGVVYQATNWLYTGLSAKRTNWTIEGLNRHNQTIADKYTAKELRDIYADKFKIVDRPRKHRYVYLRKKCLLEKLKYPILPYPK